MEVAMNQYYKNVSVLRDKIDDVNSEVDCHHWSERQTELVYAELEQLKQENDRLHHLTNVLIQHLGKIGDRGLPLKEIDKQMELFDKERGT